MSFLFFSLISTFMSLKENKYIFFFFSLLCAFFYSATFGYSYDWINYYDTFIAASKGIINYNYVFTEPGYYYLAYFISRLGFGFSGFLFLTNIFNFFCLLRFISFTKQKFFIFLVFFSFYGFYIYGGALRQAIAISFDLLAISYLLYEGSRKKFFIYATLGLLFHFTSLIVFLYLLLIKVKDDNYKRYIFNLVLLFFISLVILNNYQVISGIPYIGDKLTAYMQQFQDSGTSFLSYILSAKSILLYLCLFLFSLSLHKKYNKMYLISISLLLILLCRSNPIFLRFSFYFVPFLSFSLDLVYGQTLKKMNLTFSKTVFIFSIFLTSTMFYWTAAYREGSNGYGIIGASSSDISKLISNKCKLLETYMPGQIVIYRCI